MNGAKRIVLVRHGQTDFNLERRFQGVVDHPLNDHGRFQARNAGRILARRIVTPSLQLVRMKGLDTGGQVRILSSPLSRAFETASIIAEEFEGVSADFMGPVVDERLIERAYGLFEGKTAAEAEVDHPAEVAQWRESGESEAAGIERSDLVGLRVRAAALEAASSMDEGGTLILVSHGSAITRALVTFMGLDPLVFDEMRGLDNCHWSEVVHVGGGGSGASGRGAWRLAAHNIGYREDVFGA